MTLHHVENAFKKHAVEFQCEGFTMKRHDLPDLGIPHKIQTGTPDIKITGGYVWCDRQFHFYGDLHTDGFLGTVLIKASIINTLRISDVETVCSILDWIPGFHPILHVSDVPNAKKYGPLFWGISLRICDHEFSDLMVNAHTSSMNEALTALETHLGLEK